jgi:hypothetical protein
VCVCGILGGGGLFVIREVPHMLMVFEVGELLVRGGVQL